MTAQQKRQAAIQQSLSAILEMNEPAWAIFHDRDIL
jgi:hypothetical protein